MNERRIWSAPRGVLIDNYRNAYTTHGAVDRLNRLEAELAAAITRAETAEAERDSLATRVDQLEQCAVNTQDPESPLTWEGMQLIAVEKAAECKRIAVERDALENELIGIQARNMYRFVEELIDSEDDPSCAQLAEEHGCSDDLAAGLWEHAREFFYPRIKRLEMQVSTLITERDALAAKLSNIRDNISLIGELVCPSGHGSIECPDIDPLMCEYVCKCGDVLHEHTADIAVSNIRAILEVTP